MKKELFVFSLLLASVGFANAQIKVASNANVGIQLGTQTPLSALSIGGVGDPNTKVSIYSSGMGLNLNRTGTTSSNWNYVMLSHSDLISGKNAIGLRGQAYSTSFLNSGRAWGVMGLAGNCSDGYNYGVMGVHYGSGSGAGIVGTVNGNQDVCVPGVFAGYFGGDILVDGLVYGTLAEYSDKRYKKNVVALETKKTLNSVLQMCPVEYNLNQVYLESKSDSSKVKNGLFNESSQRFTKKHYGLIAQDLQALYPDLVYEDKNGYLSVNYTGIIPLLIQSIKELKAEVDELSNSSLKASTPKEAVNSLKTDREVVTNMESVLDQNIPNPFNTATTIGFYLPTTVNSAVIYVYDMNGAQLKTYPIRERGKSNITIQGSELKAGMYLYALIADGKVIDTKRMILTK